MNFIKRYIMWGFFLLYPLTNAYLPNVNLGFVQLDPFRLYLLLPVLYLVHIFFINVGRLKLSRETKFLAAYTIFTLFNSWRMDHFQMSNVLNFAFPVLLIILFENLEYDPRDLKRFYKVSTLLVIAVFVVSLVQKFYRHTFYSGIRRQWSVLRYTFAGGHYRHASIFRSIDFYQAGIAIGMLCLIFMFLSYEKFRLKESILSFMMMASAFLTYTRSNWIIPLIGFAFFINFKPFKKKFGLIVTSIILGVIFYLNLFPQMAESDLYRDRVTVDTYEGRFVSIEVYFRYFWGRNMFLGFGIDSGYSGEFRAYGRPEVHNGYLEVLFRDGFLGVFLYFGFWYFVFKRAVVIFKATGNGLFITFVGIFIFSNFIYKFINMGHFGYLLMLLYMYMWYDIHVKGKLDKAIETADEKTTLKAEG